MINSTLTAMFWDRVETSPDVDAQLVKRAGRWQRLTWRDVGTVVRELALGLLALGRPKEGSHRHVGRDENRASTGRRATQAGPAGQPRHGLRRSTTVPGGALDLAARRGRDIRQGAGNPHQRPVAARAASQSARTRGGYPSRRRTRSCHPTRGSRSSPCCQSTSPRRAAS